MSENAEYNIFGIVRMFLGVLKIRALVALLTHGPILLLVRENLLLVFLFPIELQTEQ
jgi:hypothetical protein